MMRYYRVILISIFMLIASIGMNPLKAQENYANTLNIALGVGGYSGYSGYVGRSVPVIMLNYELKVAKNFTLAPFIGFYSFSSEYYWGNKDHPFQYYTYKETVVPIGIKGTYYVDNLLKLNSKWDIYIAGSLGFAFINSTWQNGYYGNKNYYHDGNNMMVDLHVGAEYHFTSKIGGFVDFSSGISTLGIAIH